MTWNERRKIKRAAQAALLASMKDTLAAHERGELELPEGIHPIALRRELRTQIRIAERVFAR